jgi:hypothetical protein
VRSGCAWHYLPRDYGPWSTVDHSFRWWRRSIAGIWELVRQRAGRKLTPSAAIIAGQAVKTKQGDPRGFDREDGRQEAERPHTPALGRDPRPAAQGRRPSRRPA